MFGQIISDFGRKLDNKMAIKEIGHKGEQFLCY